MYYHHQFLVQADALGAQLAEASAAAEGHKASRAALKAAEHSKNEVQPLLHLLSFSFLKRLSCFKISASDKLILTGNKSVPVEMLTSPVRTPSNRTFTHACIAS